MLRHLAVAVATLLGATGLVLAIEGLRIPAKAAVAQILLRRSWAAARTGDEQAKPWPWADTWPVARLTASEPEVDLVVLAGANGGSLAFAPGHITGTPPPGAPGTSFIAGHRDTHFEFLQHLRLGDRLVLETPSGDSLSYEVVDLSVVDTRAAVFATDSHAVNGARVDTAAEPASPDAAGSFAARNLVLATCYPFDTAVPGGPLRYLVTAAAVP